MGLFPDIPSSNNTININSTTTTTSSSSTPSVKRKIFRSESTNNKKSDTIDKKTTNNIQLLSTSWEFVRPTLSLQSQDNGETGKADEIEPHDLIPARFIEVQKGRISLVAPHKQNESTKDREALEARIAELEDALFRLQERVNQSQCGSSTLERDLRDQVESMNRVLKSKDRRAMQAFRDHKTLQARFTKQESSVQCLQHENRTLHQRIRQYEHCLDDVMRKVVDALVAEDSLRDEVLMLKNRVRDLEAQNATLLASPAKGRDEGYCTMSSGQPQPSTNHLADLPEEPEQWLVSAESCSAEMEDWSMSQEELETALEEDTTEDSWIWNSNFLNSGNESNSEHITALLQDQIIYSDDEDLACKDFTRDFYRLVSIQSESTRSLKSPLGLQVDSSSSDEDRTERIVSPTPSEAGREQITSCSSSDSGDLVLSTLNGDVIINSNSYEKHCNDGGGGGGINSSLLEDVLNVCHKNSKIDGQILVGTPTNLGTTNSWRRSNGWKRISTQYSTEISTNPSTTNNTSIIYNTSKTTPPPVPARRSFAS